MLNPTAPITGMINAIIATVSDAATTASSALATTISPLVATCFGIYIIMMTFNYMRGDEALPIMDFMQKMIAWSLIIGFGLNASNYTNTIIPIVVGMGDEIAAVMVGGSTDVNSLDVLTLAYLKIIDDGFAAIPDGIAGLSTLAIVFLKSIVVIVGIMPLLIVSIGTLVLAKTGALMVAMVGPLFFAFALFPATRSYFSSWLNSAVSFGLLTPIFISFISLASIKISMSMFSDSNGQLIDMTFTDVFLAAIANTVLVYIVRMIGPLASQLSGGGVRFGSPKGGIGSAAAGVRNAMHQHVADKKMLKELMPQMQRSKSQEQGGDISKV